MRLSEKEMVSRVAVALLVVCILPTTTTGLPKRFLSEDGEDTEDCLTGQKPCMSLVYALGNQTITTLELLVYPGVYEYGPVELEVMEFESLSIRKIANSSGVVVFRCTFVSDTDFDNLALYSGKNFSIHGITIQECGTRASGLFITNTTSILVSNCTFRNNSGGALTLYRNQNVRVEHCLFIDNINLHTNPQRDAFSPVRYYTENSGGLAIRMDGTSNATATVFDCRFVRNRARVNERDKNDPRPHAYVISGSGGALLLRLVSNENAQMVVANCVFSDNSAEYSGGGINILIASDARNNSALISNCSFDSHYATEYGGGIFVDVFSVRENNSVIVENSVFRSGYARFCGGGVGIFQEDTLVAPRTTNASNILTIRNCTFDNNMAPDGGSAVGMVSRSRVDQSLLLTSMTDCVFTNNTATVDGTVLVIRFGAAFEGTNNFTGNTGGGVVLVLARMESKGNLWFEGNIAQYGAGISMQDSCLLNLHLDTKITFLENRATAMGGALQQRKPNQGDDRRRLSLFNTFCFIQYRVEEEYSKTLPPHKWSELGNVDVSFLNNTAGLAGAALYVSDLNECSFTGISECFNDSNKGTVYDRSIFPGPPFTFSNNQVIGKKPLGENESHNAATDPDNFTVGVEPSFKVSPGDRVTFVIEMFDQSGNRREGIWSLRQTGVHSTNITHENTAFIHEHLHTGPRESTVEYYSVSDVAPKRHPVTIEVVLYPQDDCKDTMIEKETGDQQLFEFFAIQAQSGEVISEKNITLNITCCHPGYYYNSLDGMNETCVFQTSFSHFLRRDETNRYIYLEPGYYAGFYNDTSAGQSYFSIALMPAVFQNCNPEGNRIGCLYEYDSQDKQCVSGRSGYMCGRCSMDKGVDMTLRTCKTCNAWDTVILTIICVLILVFSTIVLVFNIGLPNDLKGFLFYAQVVGFAYLNGAQNSSWDFHLSRFLGFSLYLPICPFTSLSTLWTTAFGFLPSILTIFTIITYIMCARFIKPLSRRTAFSGIWLLFLLVYKFIADTIANILKCVQIQAEGGRNYLAFYYDGSVQCFAGQHLILAIPSLILFVVVVVLAPAFIILISFKRYRITQPFTDVITEGIKTKYRWWSGFDLLRRLLFIVVVTVFDFCFPAYTQLALCFSTLVILAVLCATKPYEKTWINFIEGLILLDLLLIVIRFLNEEEFRNPYASSTNTFNYFSVVYLLLPFIYAIANVTIRIIHMLWKKYIPISAMKMNAYITQRLKPQNGKGKPLLKGQKSFDLPEPAQTRYSGEVCGDMEYTVAVGEGQHADVDYSELREELLESYNN